MVNVEPMDETIDLDGDRFIALVFSRQWPRYVASWSIRQRSGDADFPLASGEVGALPSRANPDGASIWPALRDQALTAAQSAVPASTSAPRERSLLQRLFNRGD